MNPHRAGRPSRATSRARLRTAASAVAVLALLLGWFGAAGPAAYAQEPGGTDTGSRTAVQATVVRGGDTLYSDIGTRCVVGFNARNSTAYFGMMAGHCVQGASRWYADAARTVFVGTTAGSSFPGNDYALIRYSNSLVVFAGEVSLGSTGQTRDITAAANPTVGQSVCHVGRTTGYRCGTVTAVNVTVNFPEGSVSGLFRSNICAEPGDMGGPAFSGSLALGLIIGGSGNCTTGGVTYYQPVVEWLSAYGVSIY
ncbi:S1 family peptidase [Streptomyces daliensis]